MSAFLDPSSCHYRCNISRWIFISAILLLGADIWTKEIAHNYFRNLLVPHQAEVPVWQDFFGVDFSFTYAPNHGAAWGWLAEWQVWLVALRIVTVCGLLSYLYYSRPPLRYAIPLTLISVGATGNILDTFIYGYVVDFLLFTFWGYEFAVFNLADSAISIGVLFLILQGFMPEYTDPAAC
jgi:signal peptidase II